MFKHLFSFLLFFVFYTASFGQDVRINATGNPANPSALLDVDAEGISPKKGMLIPRVTFLQRIGMNPLPAPAQGLLVYQVDQSQGFYYNQSNTTVPAWAQVADSSWSLTGNAGTIDENNFIGTLDSVAISFGFSWGRIAEDANTEMGYRANGSATNSALGFETLLNRGSGQFNTAAGYRALYTVNNAVTGNYNTAIGNTALSYTGQRNTAVGDGTVARGGSDNTGVGAAALRFTSGMQNTSLGGQSLQTNSSGNYNSVAGKIAMVNNTTGSYNTMVGTGAFRYNTIGSYNIGLGARADGGSNNTSGNYKIGIGYNSYLGTASNAVSIGRNAYTDANTIALAGVLADADKVNVGIGVPDPQSKLQVSGSLATAIRSTSANLTLTAAMHTVIIKGSAAVTLTLPSASACKGRRYAIINQSVVPANTSSAYINYTGISSTVIAPAAMLWIESSGSSWEQVL